MGNLEDALHFSFLFIVFETGCYCVALADLELATQTVLVLNSKRCSFIKYSCHVLTHVTCVAQ